MKLRYHFLLIILFIISSQAAFTQYNFKEVNANSNNPKLIKMPYSNSGGEKGISIFEYDKQGKLVKSLWRLLNNSRSSTNFYTYDDHGNIIKKYREFSDNLTSTEIFTYDEKNHLITEQFNRSDGVSNKASYIYNNNMDQVVIAKLENYHGWLTGEIHYEYQNNGKVKSGLIYQNGVTIGFINFTYNELNELMEEYWEFTGSYNQTFTFEYGTSPIIAYTSSNVFITNPGEYKITNEDYNYNGETGGPSIYNYSVGGKLEKKLYMVDDKIKTTTTYNYDSTGILTSSLRIFNTGQKTLFKYEFDDRRDLISRIYLNNDSIIGSEHYEYKNGILISGNYENFDGWLTGSISFDHAEDGKLAKGFFKGKNGFDAIITFTYDNYNNIIKIYWEFSFGKSQTYTFTYEKIN